MVLTNLIRAISNLGATDQERATSLGVSKRTLVSYKRGDLPRIVFALAERSVLAQALVADMQQYNCDKTNLARACSMNEQETA